MNSGYKSKHKHRILAAFALVTCTLVSPIEALAADQFANEVYSQAAGAEQSATKTLPSWAGVAIILGFIIVAVIMVHSVIVGRRKKQANYIKKI